MKKIFLLLLCAAAQTCTAIIVPKNFTIALLNPVTSTYGLQTSIQHQVNNTPLRNDSLGNDSLGNDSLGIDSFQIRIRNATGIPYQAKAQVIGKSRGYKEMDLIQGSSHLFTTIYDLPVTFEILEVKEILRGTDLCCILDPLFKKDEKGDIAPGAFFDFTSGTISETGQPIPKEIRNLISAFKDKVQATNVNLTCTFTKWPNAHSFELALESTNSGFILTGCPE